MQKKIKTLIVILFLGLTACSSLKTRTQINKGGEAMAQPHLTDEYGEASEDQALEAQALEAQAPEISLGLILGPGSLKALSHSGFLQALEQSKVPIKHIIGIEWGALIGGFYAASGSATKVQWELQKLKSNHLPSIGFLSKKYDAKSVSSLIKKVIPASLLLQKVKALDVKFSCPVTSYYFGATSWVSSGRLSDVLGRCVPSKPFFKSSGEWSADLFALEESIKHMSKQNLTHIIFVNPLGSGRLFTRKEFSEQPELGVLWHQLKKQTQTLRQLESKYDRLIVVDVNTSSQALFKMGSVNMLSLAGKRAAAQLLKDLGL